jgi:hypothetical protein
MPYALARWRVALPFCVALVFTMLCSTASGAVLRGTAKKDHLVGTASADTIKALRGADRIDGAGGADRVNGGPGADRIQADGSDRVTAGPGNDRIQLTADALAFGVNCGPGKDRLTFTAAVGVLNRTLAKRTKGCEQKMFLAGPVAAPVTGTTDVAGNRKIIPLVDTQPPSVPQGFRMTGRTQTSISVAWNAARDNVLVTGYRVYRNGTLITTTTQTRYTLSGLTCGTGYEISVTAIDAAGNESYRP